MWFNFTNIVRLIGRSRWPVHIGLATLALLIIASPSLAASPEQPLVASGDVSTQHQAGGPQSPDATCPQNGQCFADVDSNNPFYTFINRIYQQDLVGGYACGGLGEPCDQFNRPYYRPIDNVNRGQMAKFVDNARHLPGIDIEGASGSLTPIYTRNDNGTAIEAHTNNGVALKAVSNSNTGVYGIGGLLGVAGDSANGYGVSGNGTNNGIGVSGDSLNGIGVRGTSTNNEGMDGGTGSNHPGVYGHNTSGVFQAPGVRGDGNAGPGVYGFSNSYYGVFGQSQSSCCAGVYGNNTGSLGYGVKGASGTGYGVDGESTSNLGVRGLSSSNVGVAGQGAVGGVEGLSTDGYGVSGTSVNSNGVYGTSTNSYAGYFAGAVNITGGCTGCFGPSKVDDPLDPANKYLYQSPVQSDNMMDIYNGDVTLDANGQAWVQMPDWFDALNRDFRYQLTAVGGPGPNLYIAEKMNGNRFEIAGGSAALEVSWQVTGIRQDPYANAHRVPVEQDKPANEKGKYLDPKEYGQPTSLGIGYNSQQQSPQSTGTKP